MLSWSFVKTCELMFPQVEKVWKNTMFFSPPLCQWVVMCVWIHMKKLLGVCVCQCVNTKVHLTGQWPWMHGCAHFNDWPFWKIFRINQTLRISSCEHSNLILFFFFLHPFFIFSFSFIHPPFPCWCICGRSFQQHIRSSRRRTRRRSGVLAATLFLLSPHLPPCPMSAEWCWLRLLPAGSQSRGHAKQQPIVTDRAFLSPPARTGHRCPAVPSQRQLQLRKCEHRAANPSGAPSGAAPTSAALHQPGDAELEGQRTSRGA